VRTGTRPARTVAAIGAAVALTIAACGGDDDETASETASESAEATGDDTDAATADASSATDTSDGAADGEAAPPMQPSSIAFDAQESDGRTITVASVELPADGFVAVHGDGGGAPGPVIGNSDLLPAGTSTDVVVTLDQPLTADTTLFPMVHIDTDGNGLYEFGSVDGVDGPGLTADGDVAVTGNTVMLAGDGSTGDATGDASGGADAATITIADFAFDGVTEVPVGTTVVVTNEDDASHTWTAVDGIFDSGALANGDSFEFTFTTAGDFDYFCNFHPAMTGTIAVIG
jgi:plastocyanin